MTDRRTDRQTDRQTDGRPGKNNMSHDPEGGRHNCPIIRLSREKTGFCCMQSLLVIRFIKLLDLDLL